MGARVWDGAAQPAPQAQEPPQPQPPLPPEVASPAGVPPARAVMRLMSGMLDRLSQRGQTAASSRSAMGRSTSKTEAQALQRYSYRGMPTA